MKNKDFGKRLSQLRSETGFTQAQIATFLGVSFPAYQRWEGGGSPNNTNIKKLCEFFECSEKWLIEGKGDIHPKRQTLSDGIDIELDSKIAQNMAAADKLDDDACILYLIIMAMKESGIILTPYGIIKMQKLIKEEGFEPFKRTIIYMLRATTAIFPGWKDDTPKENLSNDD